MSNHCSEGCTPCYLLRTKILLDTVVTVLWNIIPKVDLCKCSKYFSTFFFYFCGTLWGESKSWYLLYMLLIWAIQYLNVALTYVKMSKYFSKDFKESCIEVTVLQLIFHLSKGWRKLSTFVIWTAISLKIIDKLIPSQSCNCKGVRFSLACLIALSNQEKKVLSLMFKI